MRYRTCDFFVLRGRWVIVGNVWQVDIVVTVIIIDFCNSLKYMEVYVYWHGNRLVWRGSRSGCVGGVELVSERLLGAMRIYIEKYFFWKNLVVSIFFLIFACSKRVITKYNFNT